MKIQLNKIGKRYGFNWILRNVDLELQKTGKFAFKGRNGSGKSTLLKIIAGFLTPSEGKVEYSANESPVSKGDIYQFISFSAPYIDLIETFTLKELISFHFQFKKSVADLNAQDIIDLLNLDIDPTQRIHSFSSGMKQRVKLALSICSKSAILLLDEPTSNLDQQGIEWYYELVQRFGDNRTIIVASNIESDYHFCQELYNVEDWKK